MWQDTRVTRRLGIGYPLVPLFAELRADDEITVGAGRRADANPSASGFKNHDLARPWPTCWQ